MARKSRKFSAAVILLAFSLGFSVFAQTGSNAPAASANQEVKQESKKDSSKKKKSKIKKTNHLKVISRLKPSQTPVQYKPINPK